MIFHDFIVLLLLCYLPSTVGYFWNILLSNPDVATSSESRRPEVRSHRPRHLNQKLTNGTVAHRYLEKCKYDKHCDDGHFCDKHFGFCDVLREEKEFCRTDRQCSKGLICLFGKCRIPAKPGDKGSRCTSEKDCNKNHCCARQHGEYICKKKLSMGRKCYVPKGGLDYSINEQCPCGENLSCQNIKPVTDERDSWKASWRSRWRCLPHLSS